MNERTDSESVTWIAIISAILRVIGVALVALMTAVVVNFSLVVGLGLWGGARPEWQVEALPQQIGTFALVPLVLVSLPSSRRWTAYLGVIAGAMYVAWLIWFCATSAYEVTWRLVLEGSIAVAFCGLSVVAARLVASRRPDLALAMVAIAGALSAVSPLTVKTNPVLAVVWIALTLAAASAAVVLARSRSTRSRADAS